ncbi:MAG: hypothetical protein AB1482_10970 [Pseudomonadota bacterium]
MAVELGFLGPLYSLLKDLGAFVLRRIRKPDPVAVLEQRKKWRSKFEAHLRKRDASGTRGDAIIRDVCRMDQYPNLEEKSRGISPWFKVEMKGLYHRGVEVFLRVESLVFVDDREAWRFGKYDEQGAINALLVARIPFDAVRAVEWAGDEYYPFPHIYCEFSRKRGQPYEELVFYAAHDGTDGSYFMEIAKLDEVQKVSRRLGIKRW